MTADTWPTAERSVTQICDCGFPAEPYRGILAGHTLGPGTRIECEGPRLRATGSRPEVHEIVGIGSRPTERLTLTIHATQKPMAADANTATSNTP